MKLRTVKVRIENPHIVNEGLQIPHCGNEANIQAGDTVIDKRNNGWTFQRIADHLNNKGLMTSTGKSFTPMTVKLLYERYSLIPIESQLKQRATDTSTMVLD